jgi:hypothetical protein
MRFVHYRKKWENIPILRVFLQALLQSDSPGISREEAGRLVNYAPGNTLVEKLGYVNEKIEETVREGYGEEALRKAAEEDSKKKDM